MGIYYLLGSIIISIQGTYLAEKLKSSAGSGSNFLKTNRIVPMPTRVSRTCTECKP